MSAEESASAPASAPPEVSAASKPVKRAYPAPASLPTQIGAQGIRFDFNDGCRVALPEGQWRVRLRDLDTGNILYETDIGAGRINSSKRYFLRCRIEVWVGGHAAEPVFQHDYLAEDQEVLVQFPVGTLGDTLGWFPYAVKFQELHGCRLTCAMAERLIPLFRDTYPKIRFLTHEQIVPDQFYATYSIGLFFDDEDRIHQPCDFRLVGLHRTAGYILGVDPTEVPPRIAIEDEHRPMAEPYVCIAVQSSTHSKNWNESEWLARAHRLSQGRGLPGGVHRPEAGSWYRLGVESHPTWGGRPDRRPAFIGAGALDQARGVFHRLVERTVVACLGGRSSCRSHQRLYPSDQRVHTPVSGDQLPRL